MGRDDQVTNDGHNSCIADDVSSSVSTSMRGSQTPSCPSLYCSSSSLDGCRAGVGVMLSLQPGIGLVVESLANSVIPAAERDKIRVGDVVESIDGKFPDSCFIVIDRCCHWPRWLGRYSAGDRHFLAIASPFRAPRPSFFFFVQLRKLTP